MSLRSSEPPDTAKASNISFYLIIMASRTHMTNIG